MQENAARKSLERICTDRNNALNFLRLICALLVLISHVGWIAGHNNPGLRALGPKAVVVFFGISGFLITNSWERRKSNFDYLRKRFLRIYPAYLLVLLLTAFVFAPISVWVTDHGSNHYSWSSAISYLYKNLFLHQFQTSIFNTPTDPYVKVWNPSLWTLEFEFICYLSNFLFGAVAKIRAFKYHHVLNLFGSLIFYHLLLHFAPNQKWLLDLASFSTYFLFGSALYFSRNAVKISSGVLLVTIAVISANLFLGISSTITDFGLILSALILGAKFHVPFFSTNDFSYGLYIFACPVTHLIVELFNKGKYEAFTTVTETLIFTTFFASCSWFFLEKPILKKKWGSLGPDKNTNRPNRKDF